MKKIFLVCPVRNIDVETRIAIEMYVKSLEGKGYQVHWPVRATEQKDQTGGYQICRTNFKAILESDQVHIWYVEDSSGSKFDIGGLFMLVEILGYRKDIFIVNKQEAETLDTGEKSFLKVIKYIAG